MAKRLSDIHKERVQLFTQLRNLELEVLRTRDQLHVLSHEAEQVKKAMEDEEKSKMGPVSVHWQNMEYLLCGGKLPAINQTSKYCYFCQLQTPSCHYVTWNIMICQEYYEEDGNVEDLDSPIPCMCKGCELGIRMFERQLRAQYYSIKSHHPTRQWLNESGVSDMIEQYLFNF